VCLLTNIHDPPREGNYHDKHGNAIKPAIVANYNHHMGHVDNVDGMAKWLHGQPSYMEVDKKPLFSPVGSGRCQQLHPLSSCGGKKISHRDF